MYAMSLRDHSLNDPVEDSPKLSVIFAASVQGFTAPTICCLRLDEPPLNATVIMCDGAQRRDLLTTAWRRARAMTGALGAVRSLRFASCAMILAGNPSCRCILVA